jgi:hypothetical protein
MDTAFRETKAPAILQVAQLVWEATRRFAPGVYRAWERATKRRMRAALAKADAQREARRNAET